MQGRGTTWQRALALMVAVAVVVVAAMQVRRLGAEVAAAEAAATTAELERQLQAVRQQAMELLPYGQRTKYPWAADTLCCAEAAREAVATEAALHRRVLRARLRPVTARRLSALSGGERCELSWWLPVSALSTDTRWRANEGRDGMD